MARQPTDRTGDASEQPTRGIGLTSGGPRGVVAAIVALVVVLPVVLGGGPMAGGADPVADGGDAAVDDARRVAVAAGSGLTLNESVNRTYPQPEAGGFEGVDATADGGAVMVGARQQASGSNTSALVVTVNATGNEEWNRTLNRTSGDTISASLESVVQTAGGGYLAVGRLLYASNASRQNNATAWAVRLESDGSIQWERTFTGPDEVSRFHDVVSAPGGGFVAVGKRTHPVSGSNGWAVAFDDTGAVQWRTTYNASGQDTLKGVAAASGGGYVAAGRTDSTAASSDQGLLVKFGGSGAISWNRSYGHPVQSDEFEDVEATSTGYVLAGAAVRADSGFLSPEGWLVRVDSAGAVQWNRTYRGRLSGSTEEFAGVVRLSSGDLIAVGVSDSFGATGDDGWLVRVDSNGVERGNWTADGSKDESLDDLVTTNTSGEVAAVGYSRSWDPLPAPWLLIGIPQSTSGTPTATATGSPTPTATATGSPTPTATATPSPTPAPTPAPTSTETPTPSPTSSPTPTTTPGSTQTPVPAPSATPTASPPPTPSPTRTPTPTSTSRVTVSPTSSSTASPTTSPTRTLTSTATPVPPRTLTPSPTVTTSPGLGAGAAVVALAAVLLWLRRH